MMWGLDVDPHVGSVNIGTAGWGIPAQYAAAFPQGGTHLERYAGRLGAVEINSSFYRPHLPKTYQRWAGTVPEDFRFAVKMPKEITHTRRLVAAEQPLAQFLSEAGMLGAKLGPLLVQLPPGLLFEEKTAVAFFRRLRNCFGGLIVCEPRHATWFTDEVDALLSRFQVARAAADPACVRGGAAPGGWPGLAYYRLHGSPEVYHSAYGAEYVADLGKRIARLAASAEVWCIFDNTARGEAASDALLLQRQWT
jgi:uncharacterized protein YecE (DUF72 family)